jgi:phosphonate transport system permease protein
LPPRLFDARCRACWFAAAVLALVVASFWSLDLQWRQFFSWEALRSMARFAGEFFPPDLSPAFVRRVAVGAWETLAMSMVGTLLAALAGLALALPGSRLHPGDPAWARGLTRWLLNALRSIPELVWAALLLISAGLGPLAGTLALAMHTTGVLGRLFAEAIENAPAGPGDALRVQGVGNGRVFLYATAAILGVVGAGGLGQLLAFHMGLFQIDKTATVLAAMLLMVAAVDAASHGIRRVLTR